MSERDGRELPVPAEPVGLPETSAEAPGRPAGAFPHGSYPTAMPRERSSVTRLFWSFWMVGSGGVLLGLQRQATGEWIGTGFASLGVGALVALFALIFAYASGFGGKGRHLFVPRDALSVLSAATGFCGVAFIAAGVLVPGGPWMLAEALILVLFLSRTGRAGDDPLRGPAVGQAALIALAVMLLFRLWVTYQGMRHEWAAIDVEVPVLSSLPFLIPYHVQHISLIEFSAAEFGMPSTGLDFAHSVIAWGIGFALCAGGLWLRQRLALDYENDRIQATIETLPPALALLVQRVLPEEEWGELGLQGLAARPRMKRIAALTEKRVMHQLELHSLALAAGLEPGGLGHAGELGRDVAASVRRYQELSAATRREEPGT